MASMLSQYKWFWNCCCLLACCYDVDDWKWKVCNEREREKNKWIIGLINFTSRRCSFDARRSLSHGPVCKSSFLPLKFVNYREINNKSLICAHDERWTGEREIFPPRHKVRWMVGIWWKMSNVGFVNSWEQSSEVELTSAVIYDFNLHSWHGPIAQRSFGAWKWWECREILKKNPNLMHLTFSLSPAAPVQVNFLCNIFCVSHKERVEKICKKSFPYQYCKSWKTMCMYIFAMIFHGWKCCVFPPSGVQIVYSQVQSERVHEKKVVSRVKLSNIYTVPLWILEYSFCTSQWTRRVVLCTRFSNFM